jgi:hypothetical protein
MSVRTRLNVTLYINKINLTGLKSTSNYARKDIIVTDRMPHYQHALFYVTNCAVVTLPHCTVSEFYAITLHFLRLLRYRIFKFCAITLQLLRLLRYRIFKFYFAKDGVITYCCPCISFLSSVAKVQVGVSLNILYPYFVSESLFK